MIESICDHPVRGHTRFADGPDDLARFSKRKKSKLLVQARADIILPDLREHQELMAYLFDT